MIRQSHRFQAGCGIRDRVWPVSVGCSWTRARTEVPNGIQTDNQVRTGVIGKCYLIVHTNVGVVGCEHHFIHAESASAHAHRGRIRVSISAAVLWRHGQGEIGVC